MSLFTRPGLLAGLYFACLFGALGASLPYWPLWLADWGLSPAEVGLYIAIGTFTRIPAGVILPGLADRFSARRKALLIFGLVAALATLGHVWIEDRWLLALVTIAFSACVAGMVPVSDALTLGAAKKYGLEYADLRWPGSAAFLLASLGLGAMIATWSVQIVLVAIVVLMTASALIGAIHPGGGAAQPREGAGTAETVRLLLRPQMLIFAGAVTMVMGSHAVLYAYGSLHWLSLGYSEAVIGRLWAFSVAVEIALMAFFGARLVRRLGPLGAIALAAGAGVFRWTVMAFDPPLAALWPLQALHALTFAAAHLGAMAFLQIATPERMQASAQGAVGASLGGAVTGVAIFGASAVYPTLGGATYGMGAGMAAISLICALALMRMWDGGPLKN